MSLQSSLVMLMDTAHGSRSRAAFVLGYLLGSIPFGLLLTRAAGLGDIRDIGSGNIGATNVLRTGNKRLAAATLLLDAAKGAAAVLIARLLFRRNARHVGWSRSVPRATFSLSWLRFKGGKGVATYLGVLIALAWQLAAVFAVFWLAVAKSAAYLSLAALVATSRRDHSRPGFRVGRELAMIAAH